MRTRLTILFTFTLVYCFGQYNHDFRVGTRNAQLDKLHASFERVIFSSEIDTMFMNRVSISDGEKIVYWDSLKQRPHFRFETVNGNIHGPFYCYNVNGILTTVGNYYNDSLWTFRNGYFLLSDTTFKVGLWRYYALQNPFDSTYYSAFTMDRDYKILYDSTGCFIQQWTFLNGQVWEKRIFNAKKGLTEQKIFNKDGSNYSDFELLANCSISRKWDEYGNLRWITINDKFEYWITLRRGEERFFHYKLNDPECKREELTNPKGENFQTRLFYPNGNLMEFYDNKAGIRIKYDENGEVLQVEKRKGVKVKKMNKYGG
jgi:hypothetical protein